MEANEAMKAMARRIASQFAETSENIDYEVHIALAAIMETQARDAKLAERFDLRDVRASEHGIYLATAIRAGEHYALAKQGGADAGL